MSTLSFSKDSKGSLENSECVASIRKYDDWGEELLGSRRLRIL